MLMQTLLKTIPGLLLFINLSATAQTYTESILPPTQVYFGEQSSTPVVVIESVGSGVSSLTIRAGGDHRGGLVIDYVEANVNGHLQIISRNHNDMVSVGDSRTYLFSEASRVRNVRIYAHRLKSQRDADLSVYAEFIADRKSGTYYIDGVSRNIEIDLFARRASNVTIFAQSNMVIDHVYVYYGNGQNQRLRNLEGELPAGKQFVARLPSERNITGLTVVARTMNSKRTGTFNVYID